MQSFNDVKIYALSHQWVFPYYDLDISNIKDSDGS